MNVSIRDIQRSVHANSVAKGWWDEQKRADGTLIPAMVEQEIPLKLALVHSEVSEALEEYRNDTGLTTYFKDGKPEGFAIECADAVIRLMDLCEALGLDLEEAIATKMKFNATRPHRHGGKRA